MSGQRPNILFIFLYDFGEEALGTYEPDTSPRHWVATEGWSPSDSRIVQEQQWKLYRDGRLFDMNNDPNEDNPIDPSCPNRIRRSGA